MLTDMLPRSLVFCAQVSMIQGAVTQKELLDQLGSGKISSSTVIVSYCTVGYRSGLFAQTLHSKHGIPLARLRNHNGILWHTYSLVIARRENCRDNGVLVDAHTIVITLSLSQHHTHTQPLSLCLSTHSRAITNTDYTLACMHSMSACTNSITLILIHHPYPH